jgi:hypothetical protein
VSSLEQQLQLHNTVAATVPTTDSCNSKEEEDGEGEGEEKDREEEMAFLAIPLELIRANKGLTGAQVSQAITDMRAIAIKLTNGSGSRDSGTYSTNSGGGNASSPQPDITDNETAYSFLLFSSLSTGKPSFDNTDTITETVRFPTFPSGRCLHRRFWKRLRAKRGYTYFICLQCGLKWRSPSQSQNETETTQQAQRNIQKTHRQ